MTTCTYHRPHWSGRVLHLPTPLRDRLHSALCPVACAILGVVLCQVAFGQAPTLQVAPSWFVDLHARVPGIDSRLELISGQPADRAWTAFLLAEDIANAGRSREATELARDLYLRAYAWADDPVGAVIGGGMPGDERVDAAVPDDAEAPAWPSLLKAAACMGLADLEAAPSQQAWLRGVARVIEPSLRSRDWTLPIETTTVPAGRYDTARAIGLVRGGRGGEAQRLLELPAVRDNLAREGALIFGIGGSGSAASVFERNAKQWPCTQCQNARITRITGSSESRLCSTCGGNPGPRLSRAELVGWLSLEARMLGGDQLSWAAQLAADLGAPLREPRPDELLTIYRYDPAAIVWSGSSWVSQTPESPPAESTAGAADDAP